MNSVSPSISPPGLIDSSSVTANSLDSVPVAIAISEPATTTANAKSFHPIRPEGSDRVARKRRQHENADRARLLKGLLAVLKDATTTDKIKIKKKIAISIKSSNPEISMADLKSQTQEIYTMVMEELEETNKIHSMQ